MLSRVSFFLLFLILASCSNKSFHSGQSPPGHDTWDSLLDQCVMDNGMVDYLCFQSKSSLLIRYLDYLSNNYPDEGSWSSEDQMAYWINLYNATTVNLIVNNYPVSSIKEIKGGIEIPFINSIWDRREIGLGPHLLSLNDMEHRILREKFEEPRIHFALNCASRSCPALLGKAYTGKDLEKQLESQTLRFLGDLSKNRFGTEEYKLSKIFLWYGIDFGGKKGTIRFVQEKMGFALDPDVSVSYLDYDWSLNDATE